MRWFWLGVLVLVIGGAAYVALHRPPQATPAVENGAAAPVVPPVKAGEAMVIDGKVVPVKSVALALAAGGIVAETPLAIGSPVQAGQTVLALVSDRERTSLESAEAQLAMAKARLAQLQAGPRPAEVAQAQASVESAKAELAKRQVAAAPVELAIAQAAVKQAQAQLDLVMGGPRPEEVAAQKAAVAQAQAAVDQAQEALRERTLIAPFAGVVADLAAKPGEYIGGAAAVQLADTSAWQVETTDLTELDVVDVAAGQGVTVGFDALPGVDLPGVIQRINPIGQSRNGDMTYTVVVRLEKQDPRLRWNMTATVRIGGSEK